MNSSNLLPLSIVLIVALSSAFAATAANFRIFNNCPYPIWPAAIPNGGGRQLNNGETWNLEVPAGTTSGRIWARTGCSFDGSGQGSCQTGDCGGALNCQLSGATPVTLAEYSLNQPNNLDFLDISLVDGFNQRMEFGSDSGSCSKVARCTADINGECPAELRVPDGCRNTCTSGPCTFYKSKCPDAYTFPSDDTATFACPSGSNYKVVFCP